MSRTTAVQLLLLVLVRGGGSARSDRSSVSEDFMGASINASVLDGRGNVIYTSNSEDATFGQNSPKVDIRGLVVTPTPQHGAPDRQGCDPHTGFLVPGGVASWVALLQRGNCTFKEKILRAAAFNASAVLIYNNSTDSTVRMGHEGTGDTVAVMITEAYGREILSHLDRNLSVVVCVSAHRGSHKDSRGSLLFVSVSFIVLMIVSSAWLVFYFIQKIRFSRTRGQRRLGDAAKSAIRKLNTRTVRKGDKETDPDFNHCAVCIETYQPNDVVRILPCKHVFHKVCVDPWLHEHCTCPMCKLNILKALGISASLPCVDSVALDVDRLGISQTSGSQRALLSDSSHPSISLEPLSDPEDAPRAAAAAADVSVAMTSSSFSSHSLSCELELLDIQASPHCYHDNKS